MTQQKAEYITAADAAAVETLRGYYRRNYPPNNDADFIAWVADVVKHNSAAEWQRVKARMETSTRPMETITGETYPARGELRLRCDHCKRDHDLHHCDICGGVVCGNCVTIHPCLQPARPTTNGSGADGSRHGSSAKTL